MEALACPQSTFYILKNLSFWHFLIDKKLPKQKMQSSSLHCVCFLLLGNKLSQYTLFHHCNESGLQAQLSWVLCLGSDKLQNQGFFQGGSYCRGLTGEESTSSLTQAVDRSYFHTVIGLEAPASCRWLTGSHPSS